MKTQQRIKQLEDLKLNTGRVVLWWDIEDAPEMVTFDGVRMTHKEAEEKAASLPESVQVIHVVYEDEGGENGKK